MIAQIPAKAPFAKVITSPGNIFAGYLLNFKKPTRAPNQAPKIINNVKLFEKNANIEIVKKINIPRPVSKPLQPAKRLKEFVVAVRAIGTNNQEQITPTLTTPKIGTYMEE